VVYLFFIPFTHVVDLLQVLYFQKSIETIPTNPKNLHLKTTVNLFVFFKHIQ